MWIQAVVGTAVVAYLLQSLPGIFSGSFFGGLFCFALGCIFTTVATFLGIAVLLYSLTKPHKDAHEQDDSVAPPPRRGPLARMETLTKQMGRLASNAVASGQMALQMRSKAKLQHDVPLFYGPAKPHPGTYSDGQLEGTLWTIPTSAWPREKLLPHHPPESEGPTAIAHKWHGRVADGILTLTPLGETGPRTKTEICLRGCSVSIVRECLVGALLPPTPSQALQRPDQEPSSAAPPTPPGTEAAPKKSPWMKRGALELCIPGDQQGRGDGQGVLVYGESSVFLYAPSGAAKEQWFITLSAETRPQGQEATVRAMYRDFTDKMNGAAEALGMPQLLSIPMPEPAWAGGRPLPRQQQQKQRPAGGADVRESVDGTRPGGGRSRFGWLARLVPGRRGKQQQQQQAVAVQPAVQAAVVAAASLKPAIASQDTAAAAAALQPGGSLSAATSSDSLLLSAGQARDSSGFADAGHPPSPQPHPARGTASDSGRAAAGGLQEASGRAHSKSSVELASGKDSTPLGAAMSAAAARVVASREVPPPPDPPACIGSITELPPLHQGAEGADAPPAGSANRLSLPIMPLVVDWPSTVSMPQPGVSQPGSVADLGSLQDEALPPLEPGGVSPTGSLASTRMPGDSWTLPRRASEPCSLQEMAAAAAAATAAAPNAAMPRVSSKQDLKRTQQEEEQRVREEQRRKADELKKQQQAVKKAAREEADRLKLQQREAAAAKQRASKQLGAEAEALRKQEQQASRERLQEATGGSSMAAEPAASSATGQQAEEAAPGPAVEGYSVPGLLGLNMLFTRLGFELLAGHTLQRWLSRTVQKRLDDFKRPSYLHPLKVISVDFGSTFPLVRDVRAVAGPLNSSPGACPWPQLILDLAYCGRISMTVSTTVELQQAGLIKKLQTVFGKMAGLQAEVSVPAASGPDATPAAADPGSKGGGGDTSSGPGANSGNGGGGGVLSGLLGLSRAAAAKAGSLAAGLAESLPPIKFQLEIVITRLEAELMLWTAPPPSDRLWFSFTAPPKVQMTTQPVLANRVIRYSVLLGQVSSLVKGKLLKAINRQLLYPSCGDVRLGFFANPDTAASKLHPFMSGEQVPTAAAPAEPAGMAEGVSTGSLNVAAAAQALALVSPSVRARSEASSPSASGTSTPAAALRASAPLPTGLATALNAALPPRAPKLSASLQGGTASTPGQPIGAAGGQQQQQQGGRPGKSLGFRFRFWGGNKNPSPRGSTDGNITPPAPAAALGDTLLGTLGDAATPEAPSQPEVPSSAGNLHGDRKAPLGSPNHPGFRRIGALSEPSSSPLQSPRTSIDVSGVDSTAPRHHAAEYLMGRTDGLAGGDMQTRVPLAHTAIVEGEEGAGSAAHPPGPIVKASLSEFMVPLDFGVGEGFAKVGPTVADTVDP